MMGTERRGVTIMGKLVVAAALLAGGLGAVSGVAAQDQPPCGPAHPCAPPPPLRIAIAVLPEPPLVWSRLHADLEPLRTRRPVLILGRTIPIEQLLGQAVQPLVPLPKAVLFNSPDSDAAYDAALGSETILRRAD